MEDDRDFELYGFSGQMYGHLYPKGIVGPAIERAAEFVSAMRNRIPGVLNAIDVTMEPILGGIIGSVLGRHK